MNGGPLLVLAGVWLGCQVFGGSALERLGIIGDGTDPAAKTKKPKTAAQKGQSIGTKVGDVVGFPGGPLGTAAGHVAGGLIGEAAGEAAHLGKKIGDVIGGWIP